MKDGAVFSGDIVSARKGCRMKTILKEATAEFVVEKSRFIGQIKPVKTVQEAEAFIAGVRKERWNAAHNVPAYVVGERGEHQKCSDDGEPSGTSGAPILQMLSKEQVTGLVIVITRYFGGIKLGTGGLVRAYTHTAKLALEAAGICEIKEMAVLEGKLEYSHYSKLQNAAGEGKFAIESSDFSDVVKVNLLMEKEQVEEVKQFLSELTLGGFESLSCTFRFDLCQISNGK